MAVSSAIPAIIKQKLEAFDRLQSEFEICFQFIMDLQGQKRFESFSIADIVRYLHALWICECKDRLLSIYKMSIYKNIVRHEGRTCLELLLRWQEEGDSSDVVAFLQHKLDMLPLATITRQIHEARFRHRDDGLAQRLIYGRGILLNRGINMLTACDAIVSLPEETLLQEVRDACGLYGHLPTQIANQLTEFDLPLFSYIPHQALAQRNITAMNKLTIGGIQIPADLPGNRSWRVVSPVEPLSPFAEHIVAGYQELTAPVHNNIKDVRFVDRPERSYTDTV
jgi:hypothetical protein